MPAARTGQALARRELFAPIMRAGSGKPPTVHGAWKVPLVGHAGHRVRVFTTATQAASRHAPLARVQPRTLCPAWPMATLT